jgi:L-threonylcarbamoyladenylate synthase
VSGADAEVFERCMAVGGVAVFPADTVYGLACDPTNRVAVERLYDLKRRPMKRPSAVMFFSLDVALDALPELGDRTREALRRLLPGGVSLLLPNPAGRFPLACGADPSVLGVRVVSVPLLSGVRWPVVQSSANLTGGADPRRLTDVPASLRLAADLVVDGGELPGTPSTVVDLTRYERGGSDGVSIVRHGAVGDEVIAAALDGQYHFNPDTYGEMIRADFPGFDAFEDRLVASTGGQARTILELGTGTGETARRLLARHRDASLVGIDESAAMLAAAGAALDGARIDLRVARLQDPLPDGPFELVASVLCIHHLDAEEKADLFARVRRVLAPGGRFVFGDVVLPADGSAPTVALTPGYDKPSSVADQLAWLTAAGFDARAVWEDGELALIVAAT